MSESEKWTLLGGIVLTALLVYLLGPVLTPFLAAAILAYIGDPLVDRLEAYKLPRTLSVVLVFSVLTLIALLTFFILLPMIERQLGVFAQKLPSYIDLFQHAVLPWVFEKLGVTDPKVSLEAFKLAMQEYWQPAGGTLKNMFASVAHSGLVLAGWLANLVLIPVVTFYLLRDWDHLVRRVNELIPRRSQPVVARLAKESDTVLGAFLRGQLLVMLALAMIYSAGLSLIGLDLAILIGLVAGLISFVPYLGFIVGILLAGITAIVQFHDGLHLGYVVLVFGFGQAIEGMLLTPLLVGDRIGLHPVAVIFAVLAGGQLFGFVGVLLALPVVAVIAVILRYAHERYKESGLYGRD